jgi:diguanylate cyclase (GGDEF)-like protein
VSQSTTQAPDPLIAAARVVAHGGPFEVRLDALAAQALAMAAGTGAVIFLLDGERGVFLPGGSAGLGEDVAAGLPQITLETDGASDPVAAAVQARRAAVTTVEGPLGTVLRSGDGSVGALATLPLVTEDDEGAQAVQGLLAVGLSGAPDDEVDLLARLTALADLTAAVIHQARLERAVAERSEWLERVAHIDPLTGLTNRRTFERVLEQELVRAGRQGTALSLALFDIDGLAAIDKARGADAADQVLRRVAAALADSVRLVDTVARYGGDEFALIAPGAAGRTIAERVAAAVAALDAADGTAGISVSAGLARFPDDGASGTELLEAADAALRAAKQGGRGTIAEAPPPDA